MVFLINEEMENQRFPETAKKGPNDSLLMSSARYCFASIPPPYDLTYDVEISFRKFIRTENNNDYTKMRNSLPNTTV